MFRIHTTNIKNVQQLFQIHTTKAFHWKKHTIKIKDIQDPWIIKGIKKSSKQEQKHYIKFLKQKSEKSKDIYKVHKNLFQKAKINQMKNTIYLPQRNMIAEKPGKL